MITSSNFVASARLVGLANKDPKTTVDLTTRRSNNKGFIRPGILTTRGSYNKGLLQPAVLTTRGSYHKHSMKMEIYAKLKFA